MSVVKIRFYEELNFFLAKNKKKQPINVDFAPGTTVKHLIENLGVPHTEVDLILVNGDSVGFAYLLQDNDFISVYPVFEAFDIKSVSKVRPKPLRKLKFILDVHLGTLAGQMRMLGLDARYENNLSDEMLSVIARNEHRIILTRDRGLLKRKTVTHGYCLHTKRLRDQIKEILTRFDLSKSIRPFTRCLKCNNLLTPIAKKMVKEKVPAHVFKAYHRFKKCTTCDKIYWQGSHWEQMNDRLKRLFNGW
jgi:uncharacterized protein with PIN domain